MFEPLKPTELRANLFKILDEILRTGHPREIVRNGERLMLVPLSPKLRRNLDNLPKRRSYVGDPDELANLHWDYEPDPELFGEPKG